MSHRFPQMYAARKSNSIFCLIRMHPSSFQFLISGPQARTSVCKEGLIYYDAGLARPGIAIFGPDSAGF